LQPEQICSAGIYKVDRPLVLLKSQPPRKNAQLNLPPKKLDLGRLALLRDLVKASLQLMVAAV
jgi:hypothetical protein